MSHRERVAERNAGAFLAPGGPTPAPMNALYAGPGRPGPEDEWKVPMGPVETEAEDDVILEPVHSDGTVVLPLHPTDKG
jgi:hypothetical protein